MALLLGIETGTDICSVSLAHDNKLIALRESLGGQDHASKLGVYIDEILKENGYDADEIDAVVVSKGPGSYTGLRIGVSTAKGLCYALGIPLIGVSSTESLVYVAMEDYDAGILDLDNWDEAVLCPMIDARRMEVYAQVFGPSIEPLTEVGAHIIMGESFAEFIGKGKQFVIFGNGAQKCVDVLPEKGVSFVEVTPSARGLVKPGYELFKDGKFEDTAYFEPFYLKDFVVTASKKKLF